MVSPNPIYATTPWPAANNARRQIVYPLANARAEHDTLVEQIKASKAKATGMRTTLLAVETTAVDLTNPDAGDAYVTALTTLIAAIDAAVLALAGLSSLDYGSYE